MIPEGYKQTEIGIIPEDWALHNFGEKVTVLRGGSPRPITAYLTKSNAGINWIKIGDVKPGEKYINSTEEKIIPEGASRSRVVHKGDFILSNSMSFGRPYILNIDGCIHDGWLTIQNYSETFNKNYLYYVLSSTEVFKQYVTMAAGSSVQNLNKDKVSKLLVVAPEVIREQEKIAEALSDTDDLISSLEKLIEKKKAIKQGAMQNLLTGKTRLPSFTGEWEEKKLKNLCYLITKQTGFDYTNEIKASLVKGFKNNTLPFVQNKDFNGYKINFETDYFIPVSIAEKYPKILLNETCLLISLSGRIGNVGLFCKKEKDAFIGGAVGIAKFFEKTKAEWCMLYLESSAGQKQIFECQKSGAQHNLTVEDVRNFNILIPKDIEEQKAIAEVLSDMDKEIEQLVQKLAKARLTKQGMMQQLLTGKIRLV